VVTRRRDARHARLREIAAVLARRRLGAMASVLGLDRFLPLSQSLLGHPGDAAPLRAV